MALHTEKDALIIWSSQEYVLGYKYVSCILLTRINPQSSVVRASEQTLKIINLLS